MLHLVVLEDWDITTLQVLLQSLNISPSIRVGYLTDSEIQEIEDAVKNPSKIKMPSWYLNRRADMDTGADTHLITSDLEFAITNDINREKTVMSCVAIDTCLG